jgi:hypothetical protein
MTMAPGRLCQDQFTRRALIPDRRVPMEQTLIAAYEKLRNGREVRAYCHAIAFNACEAGAAISLSPVFA